MRHPDRHHNDIQTPILRITMKVAITGASGFLGGYLIDELTANGHTCRGLSRSVRSDAAVEWVTGGLDNPEAIRSLVDGVGAVVHAAYDRPSGGFQAKDTDVVATVERNLIGTLRLIEAARQAGVSRFVVISSGAVHDEILNDRPLDETHPLWPKSHYGATKAAIEAFVSSYGRGDGFAISALRPTAIYGQADPIGTSRWYNLIASVVQGEDVTVSKGAKVVHARDVARAAMLLLAADGVDGEVYHCVDLFVTERHVAEIAREVAGTPTRINGNGPQSKHPISSPKLKNLGMMFGGYTILRATIEDIVRNLR